MQNNVIMKDVDIYITSDFMLKLTQLDKSSSKLVAKAVDKIKSNPRHPSLSIHDLSRIKCDKTFKSARVNDDYRIILSDQGNKYLLLYVDKHDSAYDWCKEKYLKSLNYGAPFLYDSFKADQVINEIKENEFQEDNVTFRLKPWINIKYLIKIGIADEFADILARVDNEEYLLKLISVFPDEIQEAILDLFFKTKTIQEVIEYLESKKINGDNNSNIYESEDAKRRFFKPKETDELVKMIDDGTYESWLLFLHPMQKKCVTIDFNGPALIEGPAGTGKTVVAIHRAVYLYEKSFMMGNESRIAICTYSKKLARDIENRLCLLLKQKGLPNQIDVLSVDALISRELSALGKNINVSMEALSDIIHETYYELNPSRAYVFFHCEYEQVIQRYNISTLEEYLKCSRKGMKVPISQKERIDVWPFFERVATKKKERNCYTYVDRAYLLLSLLSNDISIKKYTSIIVDETQDLEQAKLKAICQLAIDESNNIFLLSDENQRIYKMQSWKKDIDVNIQGRTKRLYINYRTTKQIDDYAFFQLGRKLSLNNSYRCVLNGMNPIIETFNNNKELYQYLVDKIVVLREQYQLGDICIVDPLKESCQKLLGILEMNDIPGIILTDNLIPIDEQKINICTSKGVKGLEFKVIIACNYSSIGESRKKYLSNIVDEQMHMMLQSNEKYVVATRARDILMILNIG